MKVPLVTTSIAIAVVAIIAVVFIHVSMSPAETPPYTGTASYEPFNSFLRYGTPDSSVISQSEAITVAAAPWLKPDTGMKVDAHYGLFSDDTMCAQRKNGPCRLTYQKIPAWVVTVTGPNVCSLPEGPIGPAPPTLTTAEAARCQQITVVNAKTGERLLGFS